jgi:hypothetical protein
MFAFFKKLFQAKKPNAAIAWALIQNKTGNQAERGFWLYAAPVHLAFQRDTFSMAGVLTLEAEESAALTAALNKHFSFDDNRQDNLQFFWYQDKWFLRLNNNPNITTHAPQAALNKAVGAYLPVGEGAMQWAAFTNEVQMLLFEHPINQAREAKNLPVVNSVWCYGGGKIS